MNLREFAHGVFIRQHKTRNNRMGFAVLIKFMLKHWNDRFDGLFITTETKYPANSDYEFELVSKYLVDFGKLDLNRVKAFFSQATEEFIIALTHNYVSDSSWGTNAKQLDFLTSSEQLMLAHKMPIVYIAMFSRRSKASPKRVSKQALREAIKRARPNIAQRHMLLDSLKNFQSRGGFI